MCLLTFFPDGEVPNSQAIEGLTNGAIFNPDGHGYAIVTRNGIIMRRGMDPNSVIASFVAQRERYPDGPALFHSRIGTGGSVNKKNCHPFYIGSDQKTVLAHNGILPKLAQPPKFDLRSDTRYLAECLIPEGVFGSPLTCKTDRRLFEKWLTPYNKIVVLTANPFYKFTSQIFNIESGQWEYGAWWSNDSYYPYVYRYPGLTSSKWHWDAKTKSFVNNDDDYTSRKSDCENCEEKGAIDPDYLVCWSCGYCADCNLSWTDGECLCYVRTRGNRNTGDTTILGSVETAVKEIMSTPEPIGIECSDCKKDMIFCRCDKDGDGV